MCLTLLIFLRCLEESVHLVGQHKCPLELVDFFDLRWHVMQFYTMCSDTLFYLKFPCFLLYLSSIHFEILLYLVV